MTIHLHPTADIPSNEVLLARLEAMRIYIDFTMADTGLTALMAATRGREPTDAEYDKGSAFEAAIDKARADINALCRNSLGLTAEQIGSMS